jgi:hypothetical protein
MINVNLIPDSKLQGIKAKRSKQAVQSLSVIVMIVSVALPIVFFIFDFALTKAIDSKQNKIDGLVAKFETEEDVQRILTVQNQLNSLPEAEENTFKMSNLLSVIEYSTPGEVALLGVTALNVDGSFEFQVNARSIQAANAFIDTLDSIKIVAVNEEGGGSDPIKPFEAPLTSSLSAGSDDPVSFSIKGKLNNQFGKIKKIDKFILKSQKLELNKTGEQTIKLSEGN